MTEAYDVTLPIPASVYDSAAAIAKATGKPIQAILVMLLQSGASQPPLPTLPDDEEAELAALHHLSDDALQTIANATIAPDDQTRLNDLLRVQSQGALDAAQHDELARLVERSERLMVRKAEAAFILKQRNAS